MIFPKLETEATLQISDKTRLDGTKSYLSKGEAAITAMSIEPHTGDGFISILSTNAKDWYLDWEYSTAGTKTATLKITTNGSPVTVSKQIVVVSSATDRLFSADSDLIQHEPDILRWVPSGRSSFLNLHRRAQELIVNYLAEQGYVDSSGAKYTKDDLIDISEVKDWSIYLTLMLVYQGASNSRDDIYWQKMQFYESKMIDCRNKSILKIDVDGDGTIATSEYIATHSSGLYRR